VLVDSLCAGLLAAVRRQGLRALLRVVVTACRWSLSMGPRAQGPATTALPSSHAAAQASFAHQQLPARCRADTPRECTASSTYAPLVHDESSRATGLSGGGPCLSTPTEKPAGFRPNAHHPTAAAAVTERRLPRNATFPPRVRPASRPSSWTSWRHDQSGSAV
jgi:hypothetical protein